MFGWLKRMIGWTGEESPTFEDADEMESLPIVDVEADQTEFKTYAEAMSWIFKTGRPAIFNWDEKKRVYVRGEV